MAEVFKLDAIVVIGGDGSFRGARDLSKEGVNVVCIIKIWPRAYLYNWLFQNPSVAYVCSAPSSLL